MALIGCRFSIISSSKWSTTEARSWNRTLASLLIHDSAEKKYIHIIFTTGLTYLGQRPAIVPNFRWWIAGPEHGVFQRHSMVVIQVFSFIVMHCDWIIMLVAYLERQGGHLRSLCRRFGRLRLGAGWHAWEWAGGWWGGIWTCWTLWLSVRMLVTWGSPHLECESWHDLWSLWCFGHVQECRITEYSCFRNMSRTRKISMVQVGC